MGCPPLSAPSPPFSRGERLKSAILTPPPPHLIRVHHSGSPPEQKHSISLSTLSTDRQHFTIRDLNPNNNTLALRRCLSHQPTTLPTHEPARAAHKHPNASTNHTQAIPTSEPTRHRGHPKHPRLSQRNPCSIHIRYPYHDPHTARAGKSVNRYHGSCAPSPQTPPKYTATDTATPPQPPPPAPPLAQGTTTLTHAPDAPQRTKVARRVEAPQRMPAVAHDSGKQFRRPQAPIGQPLHRHRLRQRAPQHAQQRCAQR